MVVCVIYGRGLELWMWAWGCMKLRAFLPAALAAHLTPPYRILHDPETCNSEVSSSQSKAQEPLRRKRNKHPKLPHHAFSTILDIVPMASAAASSMSSFAYMFIPNVSELLKV